MSLTGARPATVAAPRTRGPRLLFSGLIDLERPTVELSAGQTGCRRCAAPGRNGARSCPRGLPRAPTGGPSPGRSRCASLSPGGPLASGTPNLPEGPEPGHRAARPSGSPRSAVGDRLSEVGLEDWLDDRRPRGVVLLVRVQPVDAVESAVGLAVWSEDRRGEVDEANACFGQSVLFDQPVGFLGDGPVAPACARGRDREIVDGYVRRPAM
jgi:hypothetical protein